MHQLCGGLDRWAVLWQTHHTLCQYCAVLQCICKAACHKILPSGPDCLSEKRQETSQVVERHTVPHHTCTSTQRDSPIQRVLHPCASIVESHMKPGENALQCNEADVMQPSPHINQAACTGIAFKAVNAVLETHLTTLPLSFDHAASTWSAYRSMPLTVTSCSSGLPW